MFLRHIQTIYSLYTLIQNFTVGKIRFLFSLSLFASVLSMLRVMTTSRERFVLDHTSPFIKALSLPFCLWLLVLPSCLLFQAMWPKYFNTLPLFHPLHFTVWLFCHSFLLRWFSLNITTAPSAVIGSETRQKLPLI